VKITLFSVNGRAVSTKNVFCKAGVEEVIDVNDLKKTARGIYYMSVEMNGHIKMIKKMLTL
jgi:hypothetical protein